MKKLCLIFILLVSMQAVANNLIKEKSLLDYNTEVCIDIDVGVVPAIAFIENEITLFVENQIPMGDDQIILISKTTLKNPVNRYNTVSADDNVPWRNYNRNLVNKKRKAIFYKRKSNSSGGMPRMC